LQAQNKITGQSRQILFEGLPPQTQDLHGFFRQSRKSLINMDRIIDLELGIQPEAAVSGAVVIQTEFSTVLTFNAMRPTDKMSPYGGPYMIDAGTAIFRFKRCLATRFGYPNDEARDGIPRFKDTVYGIYEVQHSSWIRDTIRDNRYRFPSTSDDYIGRHLVFAFHDSTFECLTDDFEFELSTDPYTSILARIAERVCAE
jgi:hypothetical protein